MNEISKSKQISAFIVGICMIGALGILTMAIIYDTSNIKQMIERRGK